MKYVISIIFLALFAAAQAAEHAVTTWAALSTKLASGDVQANDTVFLDAATFSATSAISWTPPANVTIRGRGTSTLGGGGLTVVTDNFSGGSAISKLA